MLGSINTPMNKGVSSVVYVIQELPGTRMGAPKFNIMGASRYGKIVTLLPENSQIILSPGPLIYKLRKFIRSSSKNLYFSYLYLKAVSIMLNQSPSNYFDLITI